MIYALINDGVSGGGIDSISSLVGFESSRTKIEMREAIHQGAAPSCGSVSTNYRDYWTTNGTGYKSRYFLTNVSIEDEAECACEV